MSERTINGGTFAAGTAQGDPDKLAYLHNAGWRGKLRVGVGRPLQVDPRACPGCMFPDAPEGKWPHLDDLRCKLVNRRIVTERRIATDRRIVTEFLAEGRRLEKELGRPIQ